MRFLISVAVTFVLSACTPLQIGGPYASRFSEGDVREITALVPHRHDMHHGILSISAIRPDAVRILVGRSWDNVGSQTWFIAVRRNGKWTIDERSIQTLKSVSPSQT
jgi:hypothetical protein